jgi:ribonuclease-3
LPELWKKEYINFERLATLVIGPELLKKINLTFHNPSLLQQALTHSSYVNENAETTIQDNELLEFLGDAILNFIVAETIFNRFPELSEGKLTEIRVALIREETLAQIAAALNLGNYLQLGKGEETSGGRKKLSNLADTLEALIGAIYLDQGLDVTRQFVVENLEPYISDISDRQITKNYKSRLQEYLQSEQKKLPVYRLLQVSGPDHDRDFTAEVSINAQILGTGTGKNKKAAEMEAARIACEKLGI